MKFRSVLLCIAAGPMLAAVLLALPTHAMPEARHINVTASRFSYTPSDITVKKGEPVVLVITSTDVAHGLRFRELGLDAKVGKGQSSEISFTPEKIGDFVGHCSVFCGSGHGSMKLTLHVVE